MPDKMQVDIRQGINPKKIKQGKYEVDHYVALCQGGSNDLSNLWIQPRINKYKKVNYGFAEKDLLEQYICGKIKEGTLTPKEAYNKITTDWVKFYLESGAGIGKENRIMGGVLVGDDYDE